MTLPPGSTRRLRVRFRWSRCPKRCRAPAGDETLDGDPDSRRRAFIPLADHTGRVVRAAAALCAAFGPTLAPESAAAVATAARWHDVGKAHTAFQARMTTDDAAAHPRPAGLLAKAREYDRRAGRPYFRHELASALAFLAQRAWARDADLVAYLVAAHHGKVRLSLRAVPAETAPQPPGGPRFARGVWEGDDLPAVALDGGEAWAGGSLALSVMEPGWDPDTGASWTERTRALLAEHGPFRLAWLEALVRIADWRASAEEQEAGGDA